MAQLSVLFIIFLISTNLWGQDERYYRKMLSGGLAISEKSVDSVPKFQVSGPAYLVDLNGDGIEERIIPEKRDGVDWLKIEDSSFSTIFETKIFATGANSHLYKVKLASLNTRVKVLILFLDEGTTEGAKLESYGKISLLSFENNNLSSMKFQEGARFYHEFKGQREQYSRRSYNVNVYDIDKDGEREVVVEYQHIQRVFKYAGFGEWRIF